MRTADGVVHDPGYTHALACQGGTAASQRQEVAPHIVTTCLWCLTGSLATGLRWFKYADEK